MEEYPMAQRQVIKNEYDGHRKPSQRLERGQTALDFAYSDNASEVDAGIKETMKGLKLSILYMGIALYRINVASYYVDLGFRRFGEYIDHLVEDTGMSRANLYNWTYIGEAYVTHRADLERVGFNDDDGPTKLPYLSRALENHTKQQVYKNVINMSKREFAEWALASETAIQAPQFSYKNVGIKNDQVFAGEDPLVSFATNLSSDDRRYYERVILEAARARENNEIIRAYRFYDEAKARRFDRVYDRELKTVREKK
jgi:hypothetical protein